MKSIKFLFVVLSGKTVMEITFDNRVNYHLSWIYTPTSGGSRVEGTSHPAIDFEGWHHLEISFNQ
jgi:hypothetical protein